MGYLLGLHTPVCGFDAEQRDHRHDALGQYHRPPDAADASHQNREQVQQDAADDKSPQDGEHGGGERPHDGLEIRCGPDVDSHEQEREEIDADDFRRSLDHCRSGVHEKLDDLRGKQQSRRGEHDAHEQHRCQRDPAQPEDAGELSRAVIIGRNGLDGLSHAGIDMLEHAGAGEHHAEDRKRDLAAVAHDLVVQNAGQDDERKFQDRCAEAGGNRFADRAREPERAHQL